MRRSVRQCNAVTLPASAPCQKTFALQPGAALKGSRFFVGSWFGAWNPVKSGDSCAAVTGYDLPGNSGSCRGVVAAYAMGSPQGQSAAANRWAGEGGRKVRGIRPKGEPRRKPGVRTLARTALIRVAVCTGWPGQFFRKKENESCSMPNPGIVPAADRFLIDRERRRTPGMRSDFLSLRNCQEIPIRS